MMVFSGSRGFFRVFDIIQDKELSDAVQHLGSGAEIHETYPRRASYVAGVKYRFAHPFISY